MKRKFTRGISSSLLMLALPLVSMTVYASILTVQLTDAQQKPLPYAVLELVNPAYPAQQPATGQVIQQKLMFQPYVSVVQQGALVDFPNLDKTRHHVYSFSEAKQFELRLYAGKPEAPVQFDQPGIVTLGCNIHDSMLAYLYISGSRYAAVSNENGIVTFTDLPEGQFDIKIWHPWQHQPIAMQKIDVATQPLTLNIRLDIEPQPLPEPVKRGFNSDY